MAETIIQVQSMNDLVLWSNWNQTQTYSTTTTANIWIDWNNGTTGSASMTGSTIWGQWQTLYATGTGTTNFTITSNGLAAVVPAAPRRAEDQWNDIRVRNEARRLDRDADAVNARARVEAAKLLAMVLTEDQMTDYALHKHFDVVGSEGGIYRIHHGTSGNIRQLIDGKEVNRLCVHPQLSDEHGYLPTEDCLAAQALALMHDERGAVNKANVHQGVRHLRAA